MRIVLLGEPATGKSSMLVALYGALLHRRAGALRIERPLEDVEFLSSGLEAHGRLRSVRRTELDADSRLALALSRDRQSLTIELPDRSGELVRTTLDRRLWDPHLLALVSTADGAMLFLRSDWLAPAPPVEAPPPDLLGDDTATPVSDGPPADVPSDAAVELRELVHAEPAQPGAATQAPGLEERGAPASWEPSQMPIDVRSVDLLQAALAHRTDRLPVAVIASAWDCAGAGHAPAQWLAAQAPLLAQFLDANSRQLPHHVFGVSAQGADFGTNGTHPADPDDPWDRAFLVRADGTAGTLAAPIEWLLDAA
jgi:hypothetical protein